jgi:hypothetical protein
MKRILGSLWLLLATLGIQDAEAKATDWCQAGLPSNAGMGREIDNMGVYPLKLSKVDDAMRLLGQGSVRLLEDHELNDLMLSVGPKYTGQYYLVRSGVYFDSEYHFEEKKYISDALIRRVFQYRDADGHLSVISFQSSPSRKLQGYPLLIRSPVSIRTLRSYCKGHW